MHDEQCKEPPSRPSHHDQIGFVNTGYDVNAHIWEERDVSGIISVHLE